MFALNSQDSQKKLPALLLRAGLAFVFIYAGVASLVDSREWIGYFPSVLTDLLPVNILLKIFSAYELSLAAWLLSGVCLRWAALLCAATLGGILAANLNLLVITFRDVALIFTALALAALTWEKPKTK